MKQYKFYFLFFHITFISCVMISGDIYDENKDVSLSIKAFSLEQSMGSVSQRLTSVELRIAQLESQIKSLLNSVFVTFADNAVLINNMMIPNMGLVIINGFGLSVFSYGTITITLYFVDAIGASVTSLTGLLIVKAIDTSGVAYSDKGDFTYIEIIHGNSMIDHQPASIIVLSSGLNPLAQRFVNMINGVITLVA